MEPRVHIRRMQPEDYEQAYDLWVHTPGMHLHSLNNTYGGIAIVLASNPQSCFVAVDRDNNVVGTALGTTDGRKGYLYHVAVAEKWSHHGIGTKLVNRVHEVFKAMGIVKIGILVVADNIEGQQFWKRRGWNTRPDVVYLDHDL